MSNNKWLIFSRWLFANALGFGVGISLGIWLTMIAGKVFNVNEDRFSVFAMFICIGLANGLAQGLLASAALPRTASWALATLAGYAAAALLPGLLNLLRLPDLGLWDDAILLVTMGAIIGLAQWSLLRRMYHGTALWIPACADGFLAFLLIVAYPTSSFNQLMIVGAGVGGLSAVLTGGVLAWLTGRPLMSETPSTV
jgi:hypothetical protein